MIGKLITIGPKHPHRGEQGVVLREEHVAGADALVVELLHCPHGVGSCYVWPGDWKVDQHA